MNKHLTNRKENIYQDYPRNIKNGMQTFKKRIEIFKT